MSLSQRSPLRVPAKVVLPLIIVLAGFLIWLVSFSPLKIFPFRIAGQAYLLITVVLAFRYWPPMARWISKMPVAHRVIFGVLLGAMAIGHYTVNPSRYYPYVAWEIFPFVNNTDPVTVPEYLGTTASGRQVRLLVEQQFPSIVQFYPPTDPDANEHLANALAQVYNEHHPDDPVREVDLMMLSVELHPPPGETRNEPSCELLHQYEISSDR